MPPVNQIFTLFTEILGIVRVAQDLRNVPKYHRRLANPPTFVRADQRKPEGHAGPRPVLKVWMGKGGKDRWCLSMASCTGRHHGRPRTAGVRWHMSGSRRRDALVLLAIVALAAAGGGGVAMFTYAVWP